MKHDGSCVPGFRSRVAELFRTRKAILMLSGSMKSIPDVSGMRATLEVVGVHCFSDVLHDPLLLGKFWFVPQLVERRLPADARAVAVGRDGDGHVVQPEKKFGPAPWGAVPSERRFAVGASACRSPTPCRCGRPAGAAVVAAPAPGSGRPLPTLASR